MDYENYQSPFSWRYGSPELRSIWSEVHKRSLWRKIWVALAEIQAEYGLVRQDQVEDLRAHSVDIDIQRSLAIEAQTHHDVMAEIQAYAEQCGVGGSIIHLGMTSMDVVDNADVLRVHASVKHILGYLTRLLLEFCRQIEKWADTPVIAFTHLQPAEPTTLGYRLSQYAQELFDDWLILNNINNNLRLKGLKGAVGTRASFVALLGIDRAEELDQKFSEKLGLPIHLVTTQTYSRKQDFAVISGLAGIGATLNKFAFDLRFLQTPLVDELAEPFATGQVGSTAMPFKRNPILSEKINSLARWLAQYPRTAWDNAAYSLLERTLDDSANRRTTLPEAFLITEELLATTSRIVNGLRVNQHATAHNLTIYAPFAATERVLMALGKAGADRQTMHEHLRMHSLHAWESIKQGMPNPLANFVIQDELFLQYLASTELTSLMESGSIYVGDAPQRAKKLVDQIRTSLEDDSFID